MDKITKKEENDFPKQTFDNNTDPEKSFKYVVMEIFLRFFSPVTHFRKFVSRLFYN